MDMNGLRISIIGAGTAIPAPGRSPAGILLQNADFTALLDIGPGTISRLPVYGIDPLFLENIFITHLHPDHILDIGTLFMVLDYYGEEARQGHSLNIIACEGLKKFIDQFMRVFPDISVPAININIHEVARDEFSIGKVHLYSVLSGHTATSVSFRFEFEDVSAVYTGDCVQNPDLEMMCEQADVLIAECSYPNMWSTQDHMNACTLGQMAERAMVKQLVVVHQYPPAWEINLESQIREHYSGSIHIAKDGSKISVD